MKTPQKTGGFTLLEILVSLSIIGILTSVIYFSFDTARESSRNKAMMAEVKELQLAIELYRAQNGEYPEAPASSGCGSGAAEQIGTDSACGGEYIVGLTPDFISELPRASESANPNCDIEYRRFADGSWYKLSANECLEGNTLGPDDEMLLCPGSCGNTGGGQACEATTEFAQSFAVYSLGGQCE